MIKMNQKQLASSSGGLSGAECFAAGLSFVVGGLLVSAFLWESGTISSCWNS